MLLNLRRRLPVRVPLVLVVLPGLLLAAALAGSAEPGPIGGEEGPAPPATDALDEALGLAGLVRNDLGWEARGWWQRYPQDIPYKLRHFDDLCAEPLAVAPFLRAMGATVNQVLAPEFVAGQRNPQGGGALYRAVHDLGVNKKYGATRAYSANLTAQPTPLSSALLEAWRQEDRSTLLMTFGQEPPYPAVARDLEQACAVLPDSVDLILGKLVLDLLEARRWALMAFRNVSLETRWRVASRLDLGEEETDALEYEPAMDDAAGAWDEASLWYAGLKAVEALDTARLSLARNIAGAPGRTTRASTGHPPSGSTEPAPAVLGTIHIEIETPAGLVLIDGTGDGRLHVGEGAFLVVDLGGNDRYIGSPAASHPGLPLAAVLDLDGDDRYEGGDRSLGVGVTGIGVLLDASGSDRYRAETLGEGAGHFGMGVLLDLAGDDQYEVQYSGQGAGFFGIGLLFDLEGGDQYTLWSDGQGFGGVAGVGVLADRTGDDVYLAVPDPETTRRPSYHSEGKIAVSDAQGCGMGRRGDGSDGHSWSGGLGALLDGDGNDQYTAGNWAQGCGYWFGTGLLWDGNGDDTYEANGWASASGAHFCIGAVIDEAGDDLHSVRQNWGPAFGHDFTVALLVDPGGNDHYLCGNEGVGHSINRSVVLCLEGGGDDRYEFLTEGKRPGLTTFDPRFLDRSGTSVYWTESTSVGLFLDVEGTDTYPDGVGDGVSWTDPPASENARARNRGIFVDRDGGQIDLQRPHGGRKR